MSQGSESTERPERHWQHWSMPTFVCIAGVGLSLCLCLMARHHEQSRSEQAAAIAVQDRNELIKDAIEHLLVTQRAIQSFYAGSDNVRRDEFKGFVDPLLSWQQSVQAFSWLPKVTPQTRQQYEEAARRDGLDKFQITQMTESGQRVPVAARPEYFPVYYIEPRQGNESVLGLDILGANRAKREALEKARDTGKSCATASTEIVADSPGSAGFILYAPVYRRGAPPQSVEDRRQNVEGFVGAVFRVETIVESSLAEMQPLAIDIHIYDCTEGGNPVHVYSHWSEGRSHPATTAPDAATIDEADLHFDAPLELAGRRLMIRSVPTAAFMSDRSTWIPWGTLVSGLAITALLGGYLLANRRQTFRSQRLVEELRASNVALELENEQRRRAEEAIAASEEKYRTLLENVSVGVYRNTPGPEGKFLQANPAIVKMFGCRSLSELCQMRVSDHYQNPADRRGFAEELASRGFVRNKELRLRKMDGSAMWCSVTATARYSATGEVDWIDGVIEDITERKEADDKLKSRMAAIDATAEAVVITDRDGIIRYVNPAFTEMSGYPADEVVGGTPKLLKSDRHEAAFYKDLWQQILAGKVWRGELINRRKDGSLYPEEMSVTPVRDADGSISRFVAIKRDVTAKKQQEAMERERRSLKDAIAAMEQVLGVVGHELRTPLAGIRAMAEFLIADNGQHPEQTCSFLKMMEVESVRMAEMVNNLLEAARLNSGTVQWNWAKVDVAQVCQSAIDALRPLVDGEQIELSSAVEPHELVMRGDSGAICRLLINLATNAAKHTRHGAIRIEARRAEQDAAGFVELRVTDTGSGISAEIAGKLGEAFALNSGTIGSGYIQGSGLGLAICKGIAAAHGGRITVESIAGQGTTITALLRADLAGPATPQTNVEIVRKVA